MNTNDELWTLCEQCIELDESRLGNFARGALAAGALALGAGNAMASQPTEDRPAEEIESSISNDDMLKRGYSDPHVDYDQAKGEYTLDIDGFGATEEEAYTNAVNAARAYKSKIESNYHVKLSDDDIVKKRQTGRSFVDVIHNKGYNDDQAELAKMVDKEVNHGLKQVPIRITWGVQNFTGSDLDQLTPLERIGYPKNPYGF